MSNKDINIGDSSSNITLSSLGHTWILDLDGTIVKHNGYLIDGHDTLLDGAKEFIQAIPADDIIVFITSRSRDYEKETIGFLNEHNIAFNEIIFGAPYGERILINDKKPSGMLTSIAVNTQRDQAFDLSVTIDNDL